MKVVPIQEKPIAQELKIIKEELALLSKRVEGKLGYIICLNFLHHAKLLKILETILIILDQMLQNKLTMKRRKGTLNPTQIQKIRSQLRAQMHRIKLIQKVF